MFIDIGEHIVADIAVLALLAVSAWSFFVVSRRQRLLKFFGIHNSRRLVVYLSNLRISSGGAIDASGTARSFSGAAVPFGEMFVADHFRDLFQSPLPAFLESPHILRNLVIGGVRVQLQLSPLVPGLVEPSVSFVSLGSPGYSVASGLIESSLNSQVTFQTNTAQATMTMRGLAPISSNTYGFVERIVEPTKKRSIFYAAGLSELGTIGAASFLLAEWPRLWAKYGEKKSFVVMLDFDPSNPERWSIIFEK